MNLILRSLFIILLASLFVFSQKAEKPQTKLTEDFLSPTKQDIELAQSEGLDVFKILPRGMFDSERNSLELRGGGAYYSFTKESHSYNDTPQISLELNHLQVGFYGASYGLISDLVQSSVELAKFTNEADFLLKYTPPKFEPEIRVEQKKSRNYEINGIKLKNRVPVVVGNSYLLRAISFDEADTLVYFKIHRQDADGSLIIFWNPIKDFEIPVILRQTDEELSKKVKSTLLKKGFDKVQIEVKDNVVVLKGFVPKGKISEAVMTIMELKPRKLENQLTEQK